MNYIDQIIENCNAAKKANPIREFVFNALSDLDDIKQAIYVIEEINGDFEETFNKFKEFKQKTKRKCAKLNSPSNVMYVGTSTTGVKKRIKEHQGYGYHGTYAIHLTKWFKGTYKITIKQYDVDKEILQIIEDNLSNILEPAFGKKGGNNK